jgi:hypothetical protein
MFKPSLKFDFKIILLITTIMTFMSFTAQARTPLTQGLRESITEMKAQIDKLGEPKLEGEVLSFGSTKINGDFTLVDSLKNRFGGTATFFIKKGDTFVRVSTNVMKDGNRAVGTILDPAGPAIAAIKQGKAYYGIADVLGNIYDTGYEPIRNSKNEIIGIYYVGQPLFSGKLNIQAK